MRIPFELAETVAVVVDEGTLDAAREAYRSAAVSTGLSVPSSVASSVTV